MLQVECSGLRQLRLQRVPQRRTIAHVHAALLRLQLPRRAAHGHLGAALDAQPAGGAREQRRYLAEDG